MMQRKSVENRGRKGPVEEVSENNSAGMTEMNVVSVEVGDQTLAQDMTTAESEVSRIFGKVPLGYALNQFNPSHLQGMNSNEMLVLVLMVVWSLI